jgi:hypothetical protein
MWMICGSYVNDCVHRLQNSPFVGVTWFVYCTVMHGINSADVPVVVWQGTDAYGTVVRSQWHRETLYWGTSVQLLCNMPNILPNYMCAWTCTHFYILGHNYTYFYTFVNACTYLYTFVNTCKHLYTLVHTCIYLNKFIYTCTHLHTIVHTYTYLYTFLHTCIHLYICVHILHTFTYFYIFVHTCKTL